jgi:hypothetical protein
MLKQEKSCGFETRRTFPFFEKSWKTLLIGTGNTSIRFGIVRQRYPP